ncbi:MAG: hypothetical protein WAN74_00370 [Thermoplasmata archaeon]
MTNLLGYEVLRSLQPASVGTYEEGKDIVRTDPPMDEVLLLARSVCVHERDYPSLAMGHLEY